MINGDRIEEAARDVARVAALPEPPSSSRVRAENRFTSRAHRAGSFGEAQSCGSWSRVASRVNPSLSRARRGRSSPDAPAETPALLRCQHRAELPPSGGAAEPAACEPAAPVVVAVTAATCPPRAKPPSESPKSTRRYTTRARRRRVSSGCAHSRTRRRTRCAQLRRCARRCAR